MALAPVQKWLRKNVILMGMIVGVLVGLEFGFVGRAATDGYQADPWTVYLVKMPGQLMLRMLSCSVLPLIIATLVTGVARLDVRHLGRIGGMAVAYYLLTTVIAVLEGIALVLLIQPGIGVDYKEKTPEAQEESSPALTLLDLFTNIFPDNIFLATIRTGKTAHEIKNNSGKIEEKYGIVYKDNTNILGIIVASLVFAVLCGKLPEEKSRPMFHMFAVVEEVSMNLIMAITWIMPFGICSLIAGEIMAAGDVAGLFQKVGKYVATVTAGLFLHGCVTLPLVYLILLQRNPLIFMRGMAQAVTTAFGTSSSAATLPSTIMCLEQNLHIDPRIVRFIVPIGATVNMDGAALYEAVGTIFLAQLNGRTMNIGELVMISLTSTLASVGAAAIPGGGVVVMLMVLASVGLPQDLTLIIATDWMLDRFMTVVNVFGDGCGASIVHHYCRRYLEEDDSRKRNLMTQTTDLMTKTMELPPLTATTEEQPATTNSPGPNTEQELPETAMFSEERQEESSNQV